MAQDSALSQGDTHSYTHSHRGWCVSEPGDWVGPGGMGDGEVPTHTHTATQAGGCLSLETGPGWEMGGMGDGEAPTHTHTLPPV